MSRIIRVTEDQRDKTERGVGPRNFVVSSFDAAPDEDALPTIDWCDVHGVKAERLGCRAVNACRVVSVPVPLHLGTPVSA